jgi:hypothetical protein
MERDQSMLTKIEIATFFRDIYVLLLKKSIIFYFRTPKPDLRIRIGIILLDPDPHPRPADSDPYPKLPY